MSNISPQRLRSILFFYDAHKALKRQDRAVALEEHKERRRAFQRALSNPVAAALGPQHKPRVVRDRTVYNRNDHKRSYRDE